MDEVRRRILVNLLKVFDLWLLTLSFAAAAILVASVEQRVPLAEFLSLRVKLSNCLIFAVILIAWHGMLRLCGLYRSRSLSTREVAVLQVSKATALTTACLATGGALFSISIVTPRFLVIFCALATVFLVASRLALRMAREQAARYGRNWRYILVVGTNSRAVEFARRISDEPENGFRILGFVDGPWPRLGEFKKSGFPLVCDTRGLPEFLRRNAVDEVAMYLPLRSCYECASQAASLCEQLGISMRFDGDIFSLKNAPSQSEEMQGPYYYATHSLTLREWGPLMIKRGLDIALSMALLLLVSPILAVATVTIWLESSGPIFFLQERVGLNRRRFLMYKFRTMVPNAERMLDQLASRNEASGPVFKIANDPRITPVGKFLRRTSIDELPQLLNVLKGDMSLVGPRPLPVRDYEGFRKDWQRRRFSVRPGITCLWQICGRSSVPFEQWMRLDLQYMDEWSLWLDLKILVRTIPAVLKGSGAA
ncbi:MAG TPA: sugar transferase [Candidatus Acidoferrales bacterium]|nr:sugar transferase [Candidatus Acidoferrales bacterium]